MYRHFCIQGACISEYASGIRSKYLLERGDRKFNFDVDMYETFGGILENDYLF